MGIPDWAIMGKRAQRNGRRTKKQRRPRDASAPGGRRRGLVESDLPELRQARALWQQNQFPAALALFDKAVRKHPRNGTALVDASRAFGARFEIERAEQLLDRLLELAGGDPRILHLCGQSYRMVYRPDKAIECFQRVIGARQSPADAYLELAVLYERRGRLSEADAVVRECLARWPDSLEMRLIDARLRRRSGNASAAETILRDVTQDPKAHWMLTAQAWSELGQLRDEQADYGQAMAAALKGKQILGRRANAIAHQSQRESESLGTLASELTAEHLRSWQEAGQDLSSERVALLTGPPRSGTTLLEKVLDSHSQIVSSDEREAFPKYIFPAMLRATAAEPIGPEALDRVTLSDLLEQRKRYLRYLTAALGEPIDGRLHVDKNPSIIMLIPGMLRLFPECKLLVAVRDPRDVVISCFMRFLPLNTVSVQFLTLESTARRYVRDIDAWLKFREILPSPWLEVRYEDTVDDLAREARRVLEFLGVGWEEGVLSYRDRLRDRQVNSPTYEAVAKPVYRSAVGRWRYYEEYLAPLLDMLKPYVESFGYAASI
jgi:tetratricopeptide (TPR) repeat protein